MEWSKVLNEWVVGGIAVMLAALIAWSLYVKTAPEPAKQPQVRPHNATYQNWSQPLQPQHNLEPWRR